MKEGFSQETKELFFLEKTNEGSQMILNREIKEIKRQTQGESGS